VPPTPHLRRRWQSLAVLAGAFIVSRVAVALAGVPYNAEHVDSGAQLADPQLLADRYLETLWYLHSQPPGFNAFVGAVLRWSPFPLEGSLHAAFVLLGAALAIGCWDLARQVGVNDWWATAIAVVVTCSPVALLYENWLSYEVPVAVAAVWMAALTARWARRGNPWALLGVGLLGAAAVLTRSMMHPLWLVGALVIAVVARPPWRTDTVDGEVASAAEVDGQPTPQTLRPRRTVDRWALLALIVPLVLVGGAVTKNIVVFNTPNLSTWVGFNVHKMVVGTLDPAERERLRAEGVITAPDWPRECEVDRPWVPVLAERYKREWRGELKYENHNWECERRFHDELMRDAQVVARSNPRHVAGAAVRSAEIWANHATDYWTFVPGRAEIEPVAEFHKRAVMLTVSWDPIWELRNAWGVQLSSSDERFGVSLTLVGATLLVTAAAATVAIGLRRRRTPARLAVLAGGWTVTFVTAASILFEHAENNRIRYPAEPLTLTLAAALVVVVVSRWLKARRASAASATPASDPSLPLPG
jgi:hypothetical protein